MEDISASPSTAETPKSTHQAPGTSRRKTEDHKHSDNSRRIPINLRKDPNIEIFEDARQSHKEAQRGARERARQRLRDRSKTTSRKLSIDSPEIGADPPRVPDPPLASDNPDITHSGDELEAGYSGSLISPILRTTRSPLAFRSPVNPDVSGGDIDTEVSFAQRFPPNQLVLDPAGAEPQSHPPGALAPDPDRVEQPNRGSHLPLGAPGESDVNMRPEHSAQDRVPVSESSLARILDDKLGGLARADDLHKVMERVDQNAANTTRLGMRMSELETKINDNKLAATATIREIVKSVLEEKTSSSSGMSLEENTTISRDHRRSESPAFRPSAQYTAEILKNRNEYNIARRSIRLWPISGETELEIKEEVLAFLTSALGFPLSRLDGLAGVGIRRTNQLRNSPIYDEVSVSFPDTYLRDEIMSRGSRLSGFVDDSGRPTAGMRMEIPPHLESHFKLLREISFSLRSNHGRGTRTYVKFDDDAMDLFLEVRLQGERSWTRIDVDLARDMRRENGRLAARRLLRHDRDRAHRPQGDGNFSHFATGGNAAPVGGHRRVPSPSNHSTPQRSTSDVNPPAPQPPRTLHAITASSRPPADVDMTNASPANTAPPTYGAPDPSVSSLSSACDSAPPLPWRPKPRPPPAAM